MQLTKVMLAGLGTVVFALSAPTDQSPTGAPTTFWLDTPTQKYQCAGKDVFRCEIATGGSCFAIDLCETYCFKHDKGAACVNMGEVSEEPSSFDTSNPEAPISMSDKEILARDASPQEDKHYICSKNRRSVLICRYRFCSTDHYCKSNEECKDGPAACKNKSLSDQASKSEVREVAGRGGAPSRLVKRNRGKDKNTYVCSKDRASVLKCTYGFCATDYYCAKNHPCIDNPARCKKA